MVRMPAGTRRACLIAASALVVASCGGGGGGGGPPPGPSFSLNTNSLSFSAASPTAATPPSQNVTGMVTGTLSGTLYIVVDIAGSAVANVTNFSVAGNSGQASVSVQQPSTLGVGTFTSTLVVHACLNSPTCASGELAGSPQTVNVSYAISGPPLADTVMPHVVAAGLGGTVVLRGSGFTGTSAVSFGATPASSFTVVSDSLIHASYPATLPAGTQAIALSGGTSGFSGAIVAVGAQAYAAATLSYPATPQRIAAVVFDAQRQVLYVAAVFATTSSNQIWAYTYAGGSWSAPQAITVADLKDLILSADGSQLYALTGTSIEEFDASNPGGSVPVTVTAPFADGLPDGSTMLHFALANDGNLIIETVFNTASFGDSYVFSVGSATFSDLGGNTQLMMHADGTAAAVGASPDGSLVVAAQWVYPGNSPPTGFGYTAATEVAGPFVIPANQIADQPVAFDTNGDKIAVTDGGIYSWIVDGGANILGGIPSQIGAGIRVEIVNPQGTRAYELRSDATLHTFDLTATPSGAPADYPETNAGVPQTIPSVTSQTLRTAVTPDGATLFVGGDGGVAVIPAPQ